jgi:hypothetical protein
MKQSVTIRPATRPDHPGPDGHHSCTRCPVCDQEECAVLQDLGMACDTAQAAEEAGGLLGHAVEPPLRVRTVAGASRR